MPFDWLDSRGTGWTRHAWIWTCSNQKSTEKEQWHSKFPGWRILFPLTSIQWHGIIDYSSEHHNILVSTQTIVSSSLLHSHAMRPWHAIYLWDMTGGLALKSIQNSYTTMLVVYIACHSKRKEPIWSHIASKPCMRRIALRASLPSSTLSHFFGLQKLKYVIRYYYEQHSSNLGAQVCIWQAFGSSIHWEPLRSHFVTSAICNWQKYFWRWWNLCQFWS